MKAIIIFTDGSSITAEANEEPHGLRVRSNNAITLFPWHKVESVSYDVKDWDGNADQSN